MSVLGIVAEYDPFHNGHLHHLQSAVAAVSPSTALAVISGPFRQRGNPALLSPFSRAECALAAGVDAVFALPVLWTLRDAEHYALGAVSLLSSLGATHIAFGAETADFALLSKTAELMENPPDSVREALRTALSGGIGYPTALAKAAGVYSRKCSEILHHPNNILAVCYLRAIRRLSLSISPIVIPRSGAYHSDRIVADAPSASAVADSLRRGAWPQALDALPPFSSRVIRRDFLSGTVPDPGRLDALLLDKLRSISKEEAACLPDCTEGLDSALIKASSRVNSRDELITLLTTRRYSSARISRLCTCALLGITGKDMDKTPLPKTAMLLAMKRNLSLTGSWKNSSVQVMTAAKWLKSADPAEAAAWRIWSLCCGKTSAWPYEKKLITEC